LFHFYWFNPHLFRWGFFIAPKLLLLRWSSGFCLAFCKPNKINGLGSPTKIEGWLLLLCNWFFLALAASFTGFLLRGPGIHQIVWQ